MRRLSRDDLETVRFSDHAGGPPLVPVVAQDAATGAVLMVAWADREALSRTLETGRMHYHSRSRGRLWRKGEESGNEQGVEALWLDCDADVVLAQVRQSGPACHTLAASCFHVDAEEPPRPGGVLGALGAVVRERDAARPKGSHTTRLLEDENLRLKKLMEEAGELQVELARADAGRAREEAADLLYHALVALHAAGVPIDEVLRELHDRRA